MAGKKKIADKKEAKNSLLRLSSRYYKEYGKFVVRERALGDYRDGLKPVLRRVLWAMDQLSLRPGGPFTKSARVVGDTMGKYHPHGDASIYESMVNAANLTVKMIDGEGNWGSVTDPAAAMRYTECRLSRYAQDVMLDPFYMAVTPLVPNYDGKDKEPLYLPALLPNLLINGTFGIAFGITSAIPPIKAANVIKLVNRAVEGDSLSVKAILKQLQIVYPFGGNLVSDEDTVKAYIENGIGSLAFEPTYKVNDKTRTISILSAVPNFNWGLVLSRCGAMKFVSSTNDLTDKKSKKNGVVNFEIRLKAGDDENFEDNVAKVVRACSSTMTMATNYVEVRPDGATEPFLGTLANLIDRWVAFRLDLEKRAQSHYIGTLETRLAYLGLMRLAVDNLDMIVKALRKPDPAEVLVKSLKITSEQANTILDLQVRRLSSLSGQKVDEDIKKTKKSKATAIGHRDNPQAKVVQDNTTLMERLFAA